MSFNWAEIIALCIYLTIPILCGLAYYVYFGRNGQILAKLQMFLQDHSGPANAVLLAAFVGALAYGSIAIRRAKSEIDQQPQKVIQSISTRLHIPVELEDKPARSVQTLTLAPINFTDLNGANGGDNTGMDEIKAAIKNCKDEKKGINGCSNHGDLLKYLRVMSLSPLDIDKLQVLLDAKLDPNLPYPGSASPLDLAAFKANEPAVRLLLKKNARLSRDSGEESVLIHAVGGGSASILNILLERGASPNNLNAQRANLLMITASKGDVALMTLALRAIGGSINALDADGKSALIYACEAKQTNAVRYLLDNGANVDILDKSGYSAYNYAIAANDMVSLEFLTKHNHTPKLDRSLLIEAYDTQNTRAMEILIARKVDVRAIDSKGRTVLMKAVIDNNIMVVRKFVGLSDVIKMVDDRSQSALDYAVRLGHSEIVGLLARAGAPTNNQDKLGHAPLMVAANRGQIEIMRFLIDNGANLDARDHVGYTALWYAYGSRQQDAISYLLSRGAKVDSPDQEGRTLIMVASSLGRTDDLAILLKAGADLQKVDQQKRTALMYAFEANQIEAVKTLVDAGATWPGAQPQEKQMLKEVLEVGIKRKRLN